MDLPPGAEITELRAKLSLVPAGLRRRLATIKAGTDMLTLFQALLAVTISSRWL